MVFILFFMQVDSQSEKSPSGRQICKIKRASPNSQSDSQPKITTKKPSPKTSPSDRRNDNSGSQNSHGPPVVCISNFYKHHSPIYMYQ